MKKGKKKKKKIKFDFGPLSCVFDMNSEYRIVFMNLSVMMNCKNEQLPLKPEFNFLKFFFVEILDQNCLVRPMGRHRNENMGIKR
jgi:hypothetical protein